MYSRSGNCKAEVYGYIDLEARLAVILHPFPGHKPRAAVPLQKSKTV